MLAQKSEASINAARRAADAMNYTAATLAGGAAASAPWGPIGAAAATLLGIGSAVAWWMATDYSKLATDPPRNDFDSVSIFKQSFESFDFKAPSNEFESVWQKVVQNLLLVVGTINDTIISLERDAGISKFEIMSKKKSDEIKNLKNIQREAIMHNLNASVHLHNELLYVTPRANIEWYNLKRKFHNTEKKENPASKTRRDKFVELWKEATEPTLDQYKLNRFGITNTTEFLKYIQQQQLPKMPNILFDANFYVSIDSISSELFKLSKTL